jgi:hypothetical protein
MHADTINWLTNHPFGRKSLNAAGFEMLNGLRSSYGAKEIV